MVEINKPSRVVHKHDIEENWLKAVNFIPKQAEIVVYDVDNNHSYERFKIGDGVTNVNELPFSSESVQSNYTENDETSKAFIKNRPFGDFGDEIYSSVDVTGELTNLEFNWFSYINEEVYPLQVCDFAMPFNISNIAEGDILRISTNMGDIEGVVCIGEDEANKAVGYIGETFFYGDSSMILEKTTNISNDTSTRVTGIAWSEGSAIAAPFAIYGFGLSSVVVYSIKKVLQHITRIQGKYLPTPKLVNRANMVIDDSSTCFTLEAGGIGETDLTFDITIDDNLPNGSVKYLTIRDLHSGNSVMSSAGNLYPVSMNGVNLNELHTVGVEDDMTLQIIVNRFYGDGLEDAYKAKWILLGHNLPHAEDYTF